VYGLVAGHVILHGDFKFTIFSQQFNHSLGAFKIVIFAGAILYRHSGSCAVRFEGMKEVVVFTAAITAIILAITQGLPWIERRFFPDGMPDWFKVAVWVIVILIGSYFGVDMR